MEADRTNRSAEMAPSFIKGVEMYPRSLVWPRHTFPESVWQDLRQQQSQSSQEASLPSADTPALPPITLDLRQAESKTIVKEDRQANHEKAYLSLLARKEKLRHSGHLAEYRMIQSAINVGVVLQWSYEDIVKVVQWLQTWSKHSQLRLTTNMAIVLGEQQVLSMDEDEADATWLMRLRHEHKPENELATRRPSPYLLIKIQAALNLAFLRCWEDASQRSTNGMNVRDCFDWSAFYQKAVHLLKVPDKQCGQEVLHMLRHSKIGRGRFTTQTPGATLYKANPGIERQLNSKEKATLLGQVVSQFTAEDQSDLGSILVEIVMDVLVNPSAEKGGDLADAGMSLQKRAQQRLGDEGFLLLDFMFRRRMSYPLLVGDIVEDEDEEDVASVFDEHDRIDDQ